MNKKGTILVENIIFIILNLLFLSILVLFLARQGSGAILLEESYSKQIALLIDSSKPTMILKIDMEKGMKLAKKNEVNFEEAVKINGNIVRVKLSEKGGYSYAFFNDVEVTPIADKEDSTNELTGNYVFIITSKEGVIK